jgi:hypothetical protein
MVACGKAGEGGRHPATAGSKQPDPLLAQVPDVHGRVCHVPGGVESVALPGLDISEVAGMTCREGAAVMRRIAPGLAEGYYERLGSVRNKPIAGYRCSGYLIGDAAWLILCRRGSRTVLAMAAE